MKKLMIAAAIVCAAAFANAASIMWNVSGVTDAPGAKEGVAGENYYVYTFLTSDSSGQNTVLTLDAVLAAYAAKQYPEAVLEGLSYTSVMTDGTAAETLAGLDVTGAKAEAPITMTAMAVIFDSWNPDPDVTDAPVMANYQVVDLGELTFKMDDNLSAYGTASADNWKSVPEPTSGLLLLIGVAGLALRRRRA